MKIFLYISLFLFHLNLLTSNEIKKFIQSLDNEEKTYLENFFHRVIFHDHFAYTLEGYKSMALSGGDLYYNLVPCGKDVLISTPPSEGFWKGWTVWLKYRSHLKMSHFVLFEEPSNKSPQVKLIVLIHKPLFIKTVNDHLKIFEDVLQKKVLAEKLLEDVCIKGVQNTLKCSDLLYGILLGYGKGNSTLFSQKSKRNFFSINPSVRTDDPDQIFFNDQESCVMIPYHSINFLVNSTTAETKNLKTTYREADQKILATYKPGDLLPEVLQKLSSE